jgi:hypothetical protein
LAEAFRTFPDHPRQKPGSPAGTASEIKHTFAGTQIHQPDGFLRDVKVMAFHLLAFTLIGPAIEFLL